MAAEMPSELLTEWQAYYQISPWDLDRVEYLFADLMAFYANCNSRKRKFKLEQFLLFMRKSEAEQEEEEFERFFSRNRGGKEAEEWQKQQQ